VLDQRGRLLVAALGFAGVYDRASCASHLAGPAAGIGRVAD